jgi:hypothetical protein
MAEKDETQELIINWEKASNFFCYLGLLLFANSKYKAEDHASHLLMET